QSVPDAASLTRLSDDQPGVGQQRQELGCVG
ncbi:MAG: hypothetical protein QOJ78_2000, partial [Pseudonocardiales bacterium]|nr:hypothetical protein [Pseudonocardiales bacterium]